MSTLRPETTDGKGIAIPDNEVIQRLYKSVTKRKTLIHGQLHSGNRHCAMGCFWHDNYGAEVRTELLEEVAAVNDSVPNATVKERWQLVKAWLEYKLKEIELK